MRRRRRKMRRRRRWRGRDGYEEDLQDSHLGEEGMLVNFPLVHLPQVFFPCISRYKVLSANKKLNNHMVKNQIHAYSVIQLQKEELFKASAFWADAFYKSKSPSQFIFFIFYVLDKSCFLFKFVSVSLSASVERVDASHMRDFLIGDSFVHFPSSYTCKSCGITFFFFFLQKIFLFESPVRRKIIRVS